MDYKNKPDDELISDAWKTTDGRIISVEMMRRLKDSIEKLDKNTQKYSKKLSFYTVVLIIVGILTILFNISIKNTSCYISSEITKCERQLDLGIFGVYQWEQSW